MSELVQRLKQNNNLSDAEFKSIIDTDIYDKELALEADRVRRIHYGTDVYTRGLIEFTNYCKNNCYYCGIRCGNTQVERYRLTEKQILSCCNQGYKLGFRTFVLQGGEDPFFTDEKICHIVSEIKKAHPDCAVTLSIGEKSYESYKAYFDAGADRYLLRHETADNEHYSKLHPDNLSLENRKDCLMNLKKIGYQVGAGFMVGSPYQSTESLIKDLRFLQKLDPDMIGIGPFIAHKETPFKDMPNGTLELTLRMLSILRLMFPHVLLPATTALGTIHPTGRELGLKVGANVVMPNLSPTEVRKLYELYENKICTGEEAAECRGCLEMRIEKAGYKMVTDRGDVKRGQNAVADKTRVLFGIDLDRTLLRDDKTISEFTKNVLEDAMAKGHIIVPVTGRPYKGIPENVLNLKGIRYVISGNGASVHDVVDDKTLISHRINPEICQKILTSIDLTYAVPEIFVNGYGYVEESNYTKILKDYKGTPMYDYYVQSRIPVESILNFSSNLKEPVEGIAILIYNTSQTAFIVEKLNQIPEIKVITTVPEYIEITHEDTDKGKAFMDLASQLRIPVKSTYAMGDSGNDIPLLKKAGTKIAMANASNEVKSIADRIIQENNNDGVAKEITRIIGD